MASAPAGLIELHPTAGEPMPDAIGQYRVVHQVGKGGFAQVYFVRHRETQAPFALKLLRDTIDPALAEQVRARFLAEASIAQAIGHPAIVTIRETSAPGERPCFIVMDYIEGRPFSDHFQDLSCTARADGSTLEQPDYLFEVARLGHQVACAMAIAHQKGIVHRDLKPDNVLVTWPRGKALAEVRIVDFGIAKAPPEVFSANPGLLTRCLTELGTVMGSPPFMAPEQNGAAHTVTGKADVFALGVMLLVTTLRLEPQGETGWIFPADFDRALGLGPPLPEAWRSLLRSMVALEPTERPDMNQVARRLQRLAQPNVSFGEAVEAWLARGKMPKASRLVQFLSAAESAPYLTDDEVLFLKRVPVAKLESFKIVNRLSIGTVALFLCSGVLALALGWQKEAFERFRQDAEVRQSAHARKVAELEAKHEQDVLEATLRAAETGSREQRLKALAAALAAERARALGQARASSERMVAVRGLNEELSACTTEMQKAEQYQSALSSRLGGAQQQLESCRKEAEGASRSAADCQRDLRSKTGQLEESSERLQLCTRSLRESGGVTKPASLELGPEP